jgi:hypothetical protein
MQPTDEVLKSSDLDVDEYEDLERNSKGEMKKANVVAEFSEVTVWGRDGNGGLEVGGIGRGENGVMGRVEEWVIFAEKVHSWEE